MDGTEEIWLPVKGYEGYYEISNLCNVRSVDREVRTARNNMLVKYKGKPIKKQLLKIGYYAVALSKNDKKKTHCIHRLYADHFMPNPENKRCVNHKDGVKTNNSPENLEWATHQENMKHAHDNKLIISTGGNIYGNYEGELTPMAKLKESDVRKIRIECKYNGGNKTYSQLSREYKVSPEAIRKIVLRLNWKHII